MSFSQLNDEVFDVIVVGAGSSGGVIASRLSEDSECSVLLLEAGPDFPDEEENVPAFVVSSPIATTAGIPEFGWDLWNETSTIDHRVRLPRGRLVGGTSMVNGTVAVRGAPADFERWAEQGNPGWAWSDVLPYFKRVESDREFGDAAFHGADGPIHIRRYGEEFWSPVHAAFVEGCLEDGYRFEADLNAPSGIAGCVGPWPNNRLNEVRLGTLVTYIRSARSRANFHLRAGSTVDRILFSGAKATGVRYQNNEGEVLEAKGGLIVMAAGAYHSPSILQRSGIGPRGILREAGINQLIELPVGASLTDHANISFNVASDELGSNHGRTFVVNARGPANNEGLPAWQALAVPMQESPGKAAIIVNLTRQESLGYVAIRSADPGIAPIIDHRYLSNEADLTAFDDGWNFCQRLVHTAGFRNRNAQSIDLESSGRERAKAAVGTALHPAGTCRMGPSTNEASVVDAHLRVHGIDNLMVADASIFPDNICFNTNLTCYVVGEIAADLIQNEKKVSVTPPFAKDSDDI